MGSCTVRNYFNQLMTNKTMGYYKIQNITSQLPKRHAKTNSVQVIDITDNFKTEKISLSPNEEFLIETNFLPISIHKLRSEGIVTVIEMDKNSYHKVVNEQVKKKLAQQQPESKVVVAEPTIDLSEDKSKKYTKFVKKEK